MSLHYKFPLIKTIDDVLPAIKDRDEFIISKKDGYIVINYAVNYEDTFPVVKTNEDSIRRECRGLIFNSNDILISRPFHKFFNLNEKEDLQFNNIDLSIPHKILMKLDGSMIRFAYINNELRALTKMGITEVSIQVDEWLKNKPNYIEFIKESINWKFTAIFEWCSPYNQIIIKHDTSDLILTAIRDTFVGDYVSYDIIKIIADLYDVSSVKQYETSFISGIKKLSEIISNEKDMEGVVVRFDDGHMIKIKTLDYLLMSKARDSIIREKNIVNLIINDKIDDMIPLMSEQDKEKVIKFKDEFLKNKKLVTEQLILDVKSAINEYGDKRNFGLNCANNVLRSLTYSSWNNPDVLVPETVDIWIKNHTSSQTQIDTFRWLWNDVKWMFDWST